MNDIKKAWPTNVSIAMSKLARLFSFFKGIFDLSTRNCHFRTLKSHVPLVACNHTQEQIRDFVCCRRENQSNVQKSSSKLLIFSQKPHQINATHNSAKRSTLFLKIQKVNAVWKIHQKNEKIKLSSTWYINGLSSIGVSSLKIQKLRSCLWQNQH